MPKDTPEPGAPGPDSFWLNRIYPDAGATLGFAQASLAEIKDVCVVVLDTNVLLLPYGLGATSLDEIRKVFETLASAERVFLPAQAVREFLKNRADKLRDVVRDLARQASQIPSPTDKKIGFLEGDEDYKNFVTSTEKIKALKAESLKTIEKITFRLKSDVGSDPVSAVYTKIFSDKVVDLDKDENSEEKLKSEMEWRYAHSIPPGYKDRSKADEGIGDFLIWKTVLQIAKQKKLHCIFVTEDAKGDWWVQSEGVFQPRIELVEEYRRESGGKTIHLLPLSSMLQLFGVKADVVDEAKQAEASTVRRLGARRLLRPPTTAEITDDSTAGELVDRRGLHSRHQELLAFRHQLSKERLSIQRNLGDPTLAFDEDEKIMAALYRRQEEVNNALQENFRERRQIEELLKSSYLEE